MKYSLASIFWKLILPAIAVIVIFSLTMYVRARESTRTTDALRLIGKANEKIQQGERQEGIFLTGQAVGLARDPLILMGAAENMAQSGNKSFAIILFDEAKEMATQIDKSFLSTIERRRKILLETTAK
jgi:hypothetical protein